MSVQVSGEITAPQANRSHLEPSPITSASVPSGTEVTIKIGEYLNSGNVDQTLTFDGLSNTSNCTYVRHEFQDTSGATLTDPVTLAPAQGTNLSVTIQTASEPIGTDPTPFSFEVDTTWS